MTSLLQILKAQKLESDDILQLGGVGGEEAAADEEEEADEEAAGGDGRKLPKKNNINKIFKPITDTITTTNELRIIFVSSCNTCTQKNESIGNTLDVNQPELFRAPICSELGLKEAFEFGKELHKTIPSDDGDDDDFEFHVYCSPMPSDMITAKMISLGINNKKTINHQTINRIYSVIKPIPVQQHLMTNKNRKNYKNRMDGGGIFNKKDLYQYFLDILFIRNNVTFLTAQVWDPVTVSNRFFGLVDQKRSQLNIAKTEMEDKIKPFRDEYKLYTKKNYTYLELLTYDYWKKIPWMNKKLLNSIKPNRAFREQIKQSGMFPIFKITTILAGGEDNVILINLYKIYNNPKAENKDLNDKLSTYINGEFTFEVRPLKIKAIKVDEHDPIYIRTVNENNLENLKETLKTGTKNVTLYFEKVEFIIKLKVNDRLTLDGDKINIFKDIYMTVTNMFDTSVYDQQLILLNELLGCVEKIRSNITNIKLNIHVIPTENKPVTIENDKDDPHFTVPSGLRKKLDYIRFNELLALKCGCLVHPVHALYWKKNDNSSIDMTSIPTYYTYQEWDIEYNKRFGLSLDTVVLTPLVKIKHNTKKTLKNPTQLLSKKYGTIYNITRQKSDCYVQKVNKLFKGPDINESVLMGEEQGNKTYEGIEGFLEFQNEIVIKNKLSSGTVTKTVYNIIVVDSNFIKEILFFKKTYAPLSELSISSLDGLYLKYTDILKKEFTVKHVKKENIIKIRNKNTNIKLKELVKLPIEDAKKFIDCNIRYSYKKDVLASCKLNLLYFVKPYNTIKQDNENVALSLEYITVILKHLNNTGLLTQEIFNDINISYLNDSFKGPSLQDDWVNDHKNIVKITFHLIVLIHGLYDINCDNFYKKNNVNVLTDLLIIRKSDNSELTESKEKVISEFFKLFTKLITDKVEGTDRSKLLSDIAIKIYQPILNIKDLKITSELNDIQTEMRGKAIGKIPILYSQSRISNPNEYRGKAEKAINTKITDAFYSTTHQSILDKIKLLVAVKFKIHEFLNNDASIGHLHFKLVKFNDIILINYTVDDIISHPIIYYKAKRDLNTYKDGPSIKLDTNILGTIHKGDIFQIINVFKIGKQGDKVIKIVFQRAIEKDYLIFNENDLEPKWTREEVKNDKSLLSKSFGNKITAVVEDTLASSPLKSGKALLKKHLLNKSILSNTLPFGITDYQVLVNKLSPEDKIKLLFEIQKHNLLIEKDLLSISNIDLVSSMDIIKIIEGYTDCFMNSSDFKQTEDDDSEDYTDYTIREPPLPAINTIETQGSPKTTVLEPILLSRHVNDIPNPDQIIIDLRAFLKKLLQENLPSIPKESSTP
jgi:hypothetical protein